MTYETTPGGATVLEDRARKGQPRQIPAEIAVLCDAPIAFHRALVKPAGGALPALFLSQALYWSKRTADAEGWFWKTQEEWEDETGMTRSEQETARGYLRRKGILEEKRAGLPAKLFYRIDLLALAEIVRNCNPVKHGTFPHTGTRESSRQDAANPAFKYKESETTSETTPQRSAPNGGGERLNGHGNRKRDWPPPLEEPGAKDWRPYHTAVETFVGRTINDDEWSDVKANLVNFDTDGVCPSPSGFMALAQDARAEFKREKSQWPKYVKPLITALASVVADRREGMGA